MMTPEEIQQVVEDYRKSSQSLSENILSDKAQEFLRNLGRQDRDKVNGNGAQGTQNNNNDNVKNNKKNNNGAQGNQGATNGAQGAQSSTSSSSTGSQGVQSNNNDNVGAQATTNGAQGVQSSTANGAQGAQTNTVKKNEINLDAISQYSRKGKEVTIKDFGGLTGAQSNEVKPTNPSGKVIPTPTKPLMTNSPAAKAGIPIETRQKFANQNAAFQATKDKNSGYSKMDFIKDFPNSQTAQKYNKGEKIPGFSYKKNLNNSYEPYHIVLGYVLSEGHAETVEEAHYVMGQMDSETIQEIVSLDEAGPANKIMTGAALTLGGLGLNAITKMMQNKKKMDNDGNFTPNSTMDNIQKKNKMLDDLKSGNY